MSHTGGVARFGDRIRTLREERGLTQRELVARAAGGLTRSALSHIEAGRRLPYPRTLMSLCEALGLTIDERVTLFTLHMEVDSDAALRHLSEWNIRANIRWLCAELARRGLPPEPAPRLSRAATARRNRRREL